MNIIDLLLNNAKDSPTKVVFRFINSSDEKPFTLTNQQLLNKSLIIAHFLRENQLSHGDRAVLLFKSNEFFIPAILGCFIVGVVAVPVQPPTNIDLQRKFNNIFKDCAPQLVLSEQVMTKAINKLKNRHCELQAMRDVVIDPLFNNATAAPKPLQAAFNIDSIAFLQYTSGSTGYPKGVMITHRNLMSNLQIIHQVYGIKELEPAGFVAASWLPMTHDMGLIGMILNIFATGELTLLSPLSFMFNPLSWLKAISLYKASVSAAPNFAYQFCCDKIFENELHDLDLSCWKVAICGAERISVNTLQQFADKFSVCGFNRSAFYPSYGLAEATLCVSANKGISYDNHAVINCGPSSLDVCLVDKNQDLCASGQVGEICIAGDSVTQGYWQQPRLNDNLFYSHANSGQEYLRTGDLGYMQENNLYVLGRVKELIIINGINYFPEDIEATVRSSDVLLEGQAATAFSFYDGSKEQLIIIAEVKRHAKEEHFGSIITSVRQAVMQQHQLVIFDVILLPKARIPRTTSGKLKRLACRQAYQQNQLNELFNNFFVENNKRVFSHD